MLWWVCFAVNSVGMVFECVWCIGIAFNVLVLYLGVCWQLVFCVLQWLCLLMIVVCVVDCCCWLLLVASNVVVQDTFCFVCGVSV